MFQSFSPFRDNLTLVWNDCVHGFGRVCQTKLAKMFLKLFAMCEEC